MKFSLYEFQEGALHLVVPKTSKDGKGQTSAYITFEPGQVYETSDPIVINWVKGITPGASQNPVATPHLKQALDYYQVSYDTNKCGTCSSAKPHYRYNPFKVVEE